MNEEETKVEASVEGKKPLDVTAILDVVKKNIKWIGIAAAALVVICILGSVLSNADRYQRVADYKKVYLRQDDDVLVNVEGKTIECEEDINFIRYSADNSLTAVMDTDKTLWVVKGKKLVQVEEDVEAFRISTYGDAIAYMKDIKSGKGELYLYNVSKGKSTELSKDAYEFGYSFVMSPDGKSVAFLEADKKGNSVLMVSKNGKEAEELEKSATPYAVSDNAKYVYYVKDNKLYVNDEKIESKERVNRLFFNADCTEVLYSAGGETKYFTVKNGEAVKVDKKSLSGIGVPNGVVVAYDDMYRTVVYGIDTFDKSVVAIENGLYYMSDGGEELEKITSSLDAAQLSEDGKSLLYIDDGDLVYVKNVAKPDKAEKIKKLDADELYASKDLKTVYFINEDDELCYLKKDEGVVIAKDIYRAAYSDEYGVIYFQDDDELCYAKKTKKSVKTITDDASSLYKEGDYITFNLDDEACVMTGKSKFKNLED